MENELLNLQYDEVYRSVELGLIDSDLLKIYNYVKNGNIGDLVLINSKLTHLPNWLTEITGDLVLSNSNIEELSDKLTIKGRIFAINSKLKEFRRSEVFNNLNIDRSQITKLPDGLIIDGYLSVEGIQFEQFPKNLKIGGNFYIPKSNLLQFTNEELFKMYKISGAIIRQSF